MSITDNLISQADVNTRGRSDDAPYDHVLLGVGTNTNAPSTEAGEGGQTGMAYVAASSQYSTVPSLARSTYQGNDVSIAVRTSYASEALIYALGISDSSDGWGLGKSATTDVVLAWVNSTVPNDVISGFAVDTEYVLLVTWGGTTLTLYADAVELDTATPTPAMPDDSSPDRLSGHSRPWSRGAHAQGTGQDPPVGKVSVPT